MNKKTFKILTQYIKDLSFEAPNTPEVFISAQKSKIKVDFNVNVSGIGKNKYEVSLSVTVKSINEKDEKTIYIVECVYAGLVEAENFEEKEIHPLMLIEVPRLLFPYLRNTVSDTIAKAGFVSLMLEPIDFLGLYVKKQEELKKQKEKIEKAQKEKEKIESKEH